ncbi:MAG: ribonuclease P protein component [Saprospiraceae bacterium]|nr:ribonuclease P protein component [Saprospiraceae bacterium]
MGEYSFGRKEHLKSRKDIARLFKERQSIGVYPFRLFWLEVDEEASQEFPLLIAFSVPKKNFRKAWARNAVRRRIHEVYRLAKPRLYQSLQSKNKRLIGMLLYVAKDNKQSFNHLQYKFERVCDRLLQELSSSPSK